MGIVGLCSDHAGFELKEYIKTILDKRGLSYKDFGTYSSDSCDYPDFAHLMGKAVEAGEVYPGIAVVEIFLDTPFEGGRHQRRIDKIPL